jgi:6-phosphogluconolactonase (cycloisomerase 2 family)
MKFPARIVSEVVVLALAAASTAAQSSPVVGAVFSMTNAATGNEIVAFDRAADGTLTLSPTTYPTTGMGTGAALESQGSLVGGRDASHYWLAAVNAGSAQITLFEVTPGTSTLQMRDTVSSGGDNPISLALRGDVLYVLNAGNPNNVTGFSIDSQGKLTQIPNSMRPLSAAATDPAQLSWNPTGESLLVTERQTNLIDIFDMDPSTNLATSMASVPSNGPTPFGFAFLGSKKLVMTETFNGQTDASAVSSFSLQSQTLTLIDGSVPTTETAACWVAATRKYAYVYTANTGSNSISGFHLKKGGQLTLLDASGVTATTGNAPADLTLASDRYLYVLNGQDGTISGFKVNRATGALTSVGSAVSGLPTTGAAGLVNF